MVARRRPEKEANIEGRVDTWAKKNGWKTRKMNGLGNRSWPDRLFVAPRGGVVAFVEFKRLDEEPTEQQADTIKDLTKRGVNVAWFDNSEQAIKYLQDLVFFKKEREKHYRKLQDRL
jgi:4-aminobutyrate aminotransferase-like enzyme